MRNFIHFRSASILLGTLLGIMEEIDSSYGTFHRTEETLKSIEERASILCKQDQITLLHHIFLWFKSNKKEMNRVLSLLQDYVAASEGEDNEQRDLVGYYSLAEYRKRHNLTQSELASKLGCTQKHISDIESGKRWPSKSFVDKFASVFNTNSVWPPFVPSWLDSITGERADTDSMNAQGDEE